MMLSAAGDIGGEIRCLDFGPRTITSWRVKDKVGDGSRGWDVDCRRFQCQWIDWLVGIQVGGSSTEDGLPAVRGFFSFENFPKFFPFLIKV